MYKITFYQLDLFLVKNFSTILDLFISMKYYCKNPTSFQMEYITSLLEVLQDYEIYYNNNLMTFIKNNKIILTINK